MMAAPIRVWPHHSPEETKVADAHQHYLNPPVDGVGFTLWFECIGRPWMHPEVRKQRWTRQLWARHALRSAQYVPHSGGIERLRQFGQPEFWEDVR